MKTILRDLWSRLTAKETWRRVAWLIRLKSWKEAPPSTALSTKNVIPLEIVLIICVLIVVIGVSTGMYVVGMLHQYSNGT